MRPSGLTFAGATSYRLPDGKEPGDMIGKRARSSLMAAMISALAVTSAPASGHPHAWIDISVDILFDASGKVTGLRQSWLFDEFYTADTVRAEERNKLGALIDRVLKNLEEWGYFTRVRLGERAIGLAIPTERSARLEKNRLRLNFVTPLTEAAAPVGAALTYAIYDPTFFIEMLHDERKNAIRLIGAPPRCAARRIAPTPSSATIASAAALDRSQTGDDSLGAEFAEKVEIRCDARS